LIGDSKIFWAIPKPARIPPHPDPSCGREISRGRANPKPQKNSLPCRVRIASVSFVGIFCKMGSDFFKQTPHFPKLITILVDLFILT